jgi:hypothetical protein
MTGPGVTATEREPLKPIKEQVKFDDGARKLPPPGSAEIPEAAIPYRYCIVLVSIASIDTVSIPHRLFLYL